MSQALVVGDRVRLTGGYDYEPRWLPYGQSYLGTLVAFIPSQNSKPAAVVKLDGPITVDGVTGEMLVLELRYAGASWKETETVHVELCPFVPESKHWQYREQGKWVELSHMPRIIEPRRERMRSNPSIEGTLSGLRSPSAPHVKR